MMVPGGCYSVVMVTLSTPVTLPQFVHTPSHNNLLEMGLIPCKNKSIIKSSLQSFSH